MERRASLSVNLNMDTKGKTHGTTTNKKGKRYYGILLFTFFILGLMCVIFLKSEFVLEFEYDKVIDLHQKHFDSPVPKSFSSKTNSNENEDKNRQLKDDDKEEAIHEARNEKVAVAYHHYSCPYITTENSHLYKEFVYRKYEANKVKSEYKDYDEASPKKRDGKDQQKTRVDSKNWKENISLQNIVSNLYSDPLYYHYAIQSQSNQSDGSPLDHLQQEQELKKVVSDKQNFGVVINDEKTKSEKILLLQYLIFLQQNPSFASLKVQGLAHEEEKRIGDPELKKKCSNEFFLLGKLNNRVGFGANMRGTLQGGLTAALISRRIFMNHPLYDEYLYASCANTSSTSATKKNKENDVSNSKNYHSWEKSGSFWPRNNLECYFQPLSSCSDYIEDEVIKELEQQENERQQYLTNLNLELRLEQENETRTNTRGMILQGEEQPHLITDTLEFQFQSDLLNPMKFFPWQSILFNTSSSSSFYTPYAGVLPYSFGTEGIEEVYDNMMKPELENNNNGSSKLYNQYLYTDGQWHPYQVFSTLENSHLHHPPTISTAYVEEIRDYNKKLFHKELKNKVDKYENDKRDKTNDEQETTPKTKKNSSSSRPKNRGEDGTKNDDHFATARDQIVQDLAMKNLKERQHQQENQTNTIPTEILESWMREIDHSLLKNHLYKSPSYNLDLLAGQALIYALRPNSDLMDYLESHLAALLPDDFDPRRTISLPIRGSDKCLITKKRIIDNGEKNSVDEIDDDEFESNDEADQLLGGESTCLSFDKYMDIAEGIRQIDKELHENVYSQHGQKYNEIDTIILTSDDPRYLCPKLREKYMKKKIVENEQIGKANNSSKDDKSKSEWRFILNTYDINPPNTGAPMAAISAFEEDEKNKSKVERKSKDSSSIPMDLETWKKDQFLVMFLTLHLHMRSRYLVLNCGSNYHLLMKTMMEVGGCGVLDNHHNEILADKSNLFSSVVDQPSFSSTSMQHSIICLDDLEGTTYQICQSHDIECREKLRKVKLDRKKQKKMKIKKKNDV